MLAQRPVPARTAPRAPVPQPVSGRAKPANAPAARSAPPPAVNTTVAASGPVPALPAPPPSAPLAPAAAGSAVSMTRLIELTNRLATLIELEVAMLKERRPLDLTQTSAQKEELARAYQEELNAVRANRELVRTAPKTDIVAVRAAGERLNKALDDQRRRVQAARDVSERMLRAVTEAVERRKVPYQTYNATATYAKPNRKKPVAVPTAIAFHEVV
jgi:hypothetical protein